MQERELILDYFRVLQKKNLLGFSYLFLGDNYNLIVEILKLISCKDENPPCDSCYSCKQIKELNHPDLFIIEPEGFNIKIEAVRQGIGFLSLRSFSLPKKVLLIKDAQAFSLPAANAFLKTLEEPPKNSFIGLCASSLEGLPETIISRCRKIFLPFIQEEQELEECGQVLSFLRGKDMVFRDRKKFVSFLWSFILILREDITSGIGNRNNRLLKDRECEIILSSYRRQEKCLLLEELLKIYQVSKTVNVNLALNLLKNRL
ncbi:MAG: hypothetical protein JW867_07530 [Candidatus Omnitrophica bacterium]|nr:hypothetical protein [Candidatus Omnitrophota bacterium]